MMMTPTDAPMFELLTPANSWGLGQPAVLNEATLMGSLRQPRSRLCL